MSLVHIADPASRYDEDLNAFCGKTLTGMDFFIWITTPDDLPPTCSDCIHKSGEGPRSQIRTLQARQGWSDSTVLSLILQNPFMVESVSHLLHNRADDENAQTVVG